MYNLRQAFRLRLVLLLLVASVAAWPTATYDPNDPIYSLLSAWEQEGYFAKLPMLRPYPPQLIRDCLLKVIDRGKELEKTMAKAFLGEMDGEDSLLAFTRDDTGAQIGMSTSAEGFLRTDDVSTFLRPGLELSISGSLSRGAEFSGMTGIWLWDKPETEFIPYRSAEKIYYSHGGGASITISGTTFNLPSLWKGGVFF
jgi:hypothetical protein